MAGRVRYPSSTIAEPHPIGAQSMISRSLKKALTARKVWKKELLKVTHPVPALSH